MRVLKDVSQLLDNIYADVSSNFAYFFNGVLGECVCFQGSKVNELFLIVL